MLRQVVLRQVVFRQTGTVQRFDRPSCRPRPLASVRRRPQRWLWGGLLLLGLGGAVLPQAGPWLQRQEPPLPLAVLLPPALAGLEGIDQRSLLAGLAEADAAWTPRAELLADGRTRYHYKRRSGEPPLSLAAIRALMANPPRFGPERSDTVELLAVLAQAGVRIQLAEPRKSGAAGEWDPAARTLRIKPGVVESGSIEFAKVLNHEAIHVAQSCSNGHVRARPRPLGIDALIPPHLEPVLQEPLYRAAGALEQRLEREAYANQHRLGIGADLVRRHCRLAALPS